MNTRETLNIFISGPSDVSDEKNIIEEVINDLNEAYEDSIYPYFNLITLDSHVRSKISNEHPQDIIDEAIDGKYDVFIGLLWKRFGTKTDKFNSGTEQEFYNAWDRFENGHSMDIMFYFSNSPVDIDLIDLSQLEKVKSFKNMVKDKGFYKTYDSTENFKNLIKRDLRLLAQEKIKSNSENIDNNSDDEVYLFESIESFLNSFNNAQIGLEDLVKDINYFNVEVSTLSENSNLDNLHSLKIYVNHISLCLDEFSNTLNNHSNIIMGNLNKGVDSFINLINVYGQYIIQDQQQALSLDDAMKNSIDEIDKAIFSLNNDLINPLESIPPISSKFSKSKKDSIKSVNVFIKELNNIKNSVNKSRKVLKQQFFN